MLSKIHIENFKSLKNVTPELQPVNLLIGSNNSGKTNLLKALEFLKKEEVGTNMGFADYTFKHENVDVVFLAASEKSSLQIKIEKKTADTKNDALGLPKIKFTQDVAEHWFSGFLGGVPA